MNSKQELENKSLVDFYLKLLKDIRKTHCFNCKADINSRDWNICTKCGWIKCPMFSMQMYLARPSVPTLINEDSNLFLLR